MKGDRNDEIDVQFKDWTLTLQVTWRDLADGPEIVRFEVMPLARVLVSFCYLTELNVVVNLPMQAIRQIKLELERDIRQAVIFAKLAKLSRLSGRRVGA